MSRHNKNRSKKRQQSKRKSVKTNLVGGYRA